MIGASRLDTAIGRGLAWLATQQRNDGGFLTYVGPEVGDFSAAAAYPTTFGTALILAAVGELAAAEGLAGLRDRAAAFLLAQRSSAWTFNYWPRGSEQARQRPYPDDLDDTFCSLAALQQYRPELVGAEAMAAAVRLLTLTEHEVGGPYYTWAVPREAPAQWRDVDLGVNCNVAWFLWRQGVVLPRLVELAEEAIKQRAFLTRYYAVSSYPVIYFLSRWYRGALSSELREYLWACRDGDGWWGSALNSALAVSALVNLGELTGELDAAVARMLRAQADEGGWPAGAVYAELAGRPQTLYAGSPALTTALVLEALGKVRRRPEQWVEDPVPLVKREPDARAFYEDVVARVGERFGRLDGDLREQAERALRRQIARDRDGEMVLLPYVWEKALRPSLQRAGREEVARLAVIGVYGWIGYTIYDDFLDGEGEPALLSVAHVAARELMLMLAPWRADCPDVAVLAGEVLERMDAANTWEATHCRADIKEGRLVMAEVADYGDLRQLADRSLGHALGPLSLLLIRGHRLGGPVVAQSRRFFEHYLIARQLNDDVHDWEADLARGQVNAIGAWLLRSAAGSTEELGRQPVGALLAELRGILWEREMEAICEVILAHVAAARQALSENGELRDATRLAGWLKPLEESTREVLRERARVREFVEAYQRGRRKEA